MHGKCSTVSQYNIYSTACSVEFSVHDSDRDAFLILIEDGFDHG